MVLILYTSTSVTFSCNIHVCLTWQAEKDGISFKCKVNKLLWKVMFYDPSNKELAHCLTPIPKPKCYTSDTNTIWQSRSTNSTIFVVKHQIDNSLNGPWKCSHGTNVSEAIVNITVLKEDICEKTEKESTCYEEFSAWTMFGFTLIPAASFLIQIATTVSKRFRRRGSQCFDRIPVLALINRSECIKRLLGHTWIYKRRYVLVCVLICIATGIPTAVGLSSTECKYKESFIVLGGLLALILLICYHNVETSNSRKAEVRHAATATTEQYVDNTETAGENEDQFLLIPKTESI